VPPRVFAPLRLPAGFRREVAVGGRTHVVLTTPRRLAVTPKVVWLGADVRSEPGPAPPARAGIDSGAE
jgi:hypothetical protein